MDEDNSVYYKIYKSPHLGGKLTVACMQWFDEGEYRAERFFKNKDGDVVKYDDEEEAIQWLLDNIKEELIDPAYVSKKIRTDADYYK